MLALVSLLAWVAAVTFFSGRDAPDRGIRGASASPSASPEPASDLERLDIRPAEAPHGYPAGWRRWQATDRSFSFVAPASPEGIEPSFDGDLWEVILEASPIHLYVYVSDTYLVAGAEILQLHEIADGLMAGSEELGRSPIRQQGRRGIEVVYVDRASGYRFISRLFAVEGRFIQASAGYFGSFASPQVKGQAAAFLDSFEFGPHAVLSAEAPTL